MVPRGHLLLGHVLLCHAPPLTPAGVQICSAVGPFVANFDPMLSLTRAKRNHPPRVIDEIKLSEAHGQEGSGSSLPRIHRDLQTAIRL
jgi:hypothetical protein